MRAAFTYLLLWKLHTTLLICTLLYIWYTKAVERMRETDNVPNYSSTHITILHTSLWRPWPDTGHSPTPCRWLGLALVGSEGWPVPTSPTCSRPDRLTHCRPQTPSAWPPSELWLTSSPYANKRKFFKGLSQTQYPHEAFSELSSRLCALSHMPGPHHGHAFLCSCLWCGWLVLCLSL